jgi:hypothetical protein
MRLPRKPAIMPYKQPGEVLDYDFDFTDSLAEGDTVSTATVTVSPSGLTLSTKTVSSPTVKQWVSGGTAGTRYRLTCAAVTSGGRTHEEEMVIPVAELVETA